MLLQVESDASNSSHHQAPFGHAYDAIFNSVHKANRMQEYRSENISGGRAYCAKAATIRSLMKKGAKGVDIGCAAGLNRFAELGNTLEEMVIATQRKAGILFGDDIPVHNYPNYKKFFDGTNVVRHPLGETGLFPELRLAGYIDSIAVVDNELVVIDVKSDKAIIKSEHVTLIGNEAQRLKQGESLTINKSGRDISATVPLGLRSYHKAQVEFYAIILGIKNRGIHYASRYSSEEMSDYPTERFYSFVSDHMSDAQMLGRLYVASHLAKEGFYIHKPSNIEKKKDCGFCNLTEHCWPDVNDLYASLNPKYYTGLTVEIVDGEEVVHTPFAEEGYQRELWNKYFAQAKDLTSPSEMLARSEVTIPIIKQWVIDTKEVDTTHHF